MVMFGHVWLCMIMYGYVLSCIVIYCHVLSCTVMFGHGPMDFRTTGNIGSKENLGNIGNNWKSGIKGITVI